MSRVILAALLLLPTLAAPDQAEIRQCGPAAFGDGCAGPPVTLTPR